MAISQMADNPVAMAFDAVGGIGAASRLCGRSVQALNKWRQSAVLPRTEYTGETNYSALLAAAAAKKGRPFDAAWLLDAAAPQKKGDPKVA